MSEREKNIFEPERKRRKERKRRRKERDRKQNKKDGSVHNTFKNTAWLAMVFKNGFYFEARRLKKDLKIKERRKEM